MSTITFLSFIKHNSFCILHIVGLCVWRCLWVSTYMSENNAIWFGLKKMSLILNALTWAPASKLSAFGSWHFNDLLSFVISFECIFLQTKWIVVMLWTADERAIHSRLRWLFFFFYLFSTYIPFHAFNVLQKIFSANTKNKNSDE